MRRGVLAGSRETIGKMRLHEPVSSTSVRKSSVVKINDLMAKRVITAQPHYTVALVRGLMQRNHILAISVIGPEGEAVGIVTIMTQRVQPKMTLA